MQAFVLRRLTRRAGTREAATHGYKPTRYERDWATVICALGNTDPPPRATIGRMHRTTKR